MIDDTQLFALQWLALVMAGMTIAGLIEQAWLTWRKR